MDIPHIPDYELLAEIAGGPLTCDFAARHRAGGFTCIVKTLRPEWAADANAINAIAREARIGLAVRNRHIVKMLDAQVHQSPHYLVMEHIVGDTLADTLDRGPLPWHHSLRLAGQVAGAVAAIHQVGFVHAELHPRNFVVLPAGTAVMVGLSRAHRPGELFVVDSDSCQHAAPEMDETHSHHSFASDWYAFGALLTELLTGNPLPQPEQPNNILRFRQKAAQAAWQERQAIIWPPKLTALVERLTAIRSQDRPNGAYVVNELQRLHVVEREGQLVA